MFDRDSNLILILRLIQKLFGTEFWSSPPPDYAKYVKYTKLYAKYVKYAKYMGVGVLRVLRISRILRNGCWSFAYFTYLMRGDDYGCWNCITSVICREENGTVESFVPVLHSNNRK